MFSVEENNAKIGRYLAELIDRKYKSKREFGREYLKARGEETSEENIAKMANRLTQITKGNKAIQTYDLPFFTEMLGVSCEQILSAGEFAAPVSNRVTNYSVACSKDPSEWQKYVDREDKLILNSDEYGKTILDYAWEMKNYPLLKFLMDKKLIWFDGGDDSKYIVTFGAGTSIKHRDIGHIDQELDLQLMMKDDLRIKLISLAVDNNDMKMLNELRAREVPQLYYQAHYLSMQHPDFRDSYNESLINHIVASSEEVLDYFTDSFSVRDRVKYKDGSKRKHTFLYPFIQELLDRMIAENSDFTETALKKCIDHNNWALGRLKELIASVKNDEYYAADYMKDMCLKACKELFDFYEDENIVMFSARCSNNQSDGIITNIAHVKKLPQNPSLRRLAEDLNKSYEEIKNITDHLEEI